MRRLAAEGLHLCVGRRELLRDVSLEIRAGEFVALVGPNGAGKTTLLRALAGLAVPDRGRVTLDGRPLLGIGRTERARRIAVLLHEAGPAPGLTVADLVGLGRLPHRSAFAAASSTDHAAVAAAMARAGIAPLRDRLVPSLSAGERMRVGLARAFAVEAGCLLADEPITALDPAHQIDAMARLREAAREGRAVLAVLHDLGLAARACDRIVVMRAGRIAGDGPPATVLTDALLAQVFGIAVERGIGRDGIAYLLPWTRTPTPGGTSA